MSVFLFDMAGEPIAFRRSWNDAYLFDLNGQWIGWCPWGDNHVVAPDGHYFGSVIDDRLVRRNDWCELPCDRRPDDPGTVLPEGKPTTPHPFPNRFAYQDIAATGSSVVSA